jgi:ketosteroid isomerase-like protein
MADPQQIITGVFDRYQDIVYSKDLGAFMALYEEDACIFDLWGNWSYRGQGAWRQAVKAWFESLGDERCTVRFDEIKIEAMADLAFAHAFVTYAGEDVQGKPLRAMSNRLSWGLRLSGAAWKIAHEHTSAPVSLDTMKAILQR